MAAEVDNAYVLSRPPGHHAEAARAMGFCLLNNIAVTAAALVQRGAKVAVVDWDAHHGNGIQALFAEDPDIFYISIHERPGSIRFPGTGNETEIGTGAGQGSTLNVPLSRGAGDAEYRAAFEGQVLPRLDQSG